LLVAACGQPATRKVEPLPKPEPVVERPVAPKRQPREVFAVAPSPMSIAIAGTALVWTDATGSIWTMPTTGGTPRQLSDQQKPDFAFKVVAAGGVIVASSRKDLLRVDVAGGTVTKANVTGLVEYPEEIVGDAAAIFVTMFKKDQIMRIDGASAKSIATLARGILALRGDTLYAASYSNGTLVAIPTSGGKPRTIAKDLVRPTALVADDTHAFVYSETAQTLRRIDLASGAGTVIAKNLVNSDDLVIDGDWLYTRSWDKGKRGSLLRIAKDGSSQSVLGADMDAPYNIAFDADGIYVTVRDAAQIVRFEKSALPR